MSAITVHRPAVFLIEDNLDNYYIFELFVKRAGVSYFNGRASGRYFFQWAESNPNNPIDVLFLDLQIPREDGYTILGQIKQNPAFSHMRVIAVTANVMPQDVQRCRNAGFDGFLGKPLMPQRINDQLHRIFDGENLWEPT